MEKIHKNRIYSKLRTLPTLRMRTTCAFWNGVSQCSCKFWILNLCNKKVRMSPEQFWNRVQLRSQWSGGCCTCDTSCRHSRGPARPGSSLSPCHPWETPTWRQSQSIRIRPWLCLTNSRPFQITNRKQNKVRSWQKSLRMSWQSDRMEDNTCYVVVQFVGGYGLNLSVWQRLQHLLHSALVVKFSGVPLPVLSLVTTVEEITSLMPSLIT